MLSPAAALAAAALAVLYPSVEALPSAGGPTRGPQTLGSSVDAPIELTFDWPLECPARVRQETLASVGPGTLLIDAGYNVELVDTEAPDDVEVRFGAVEIFGVDYEATREAPPTDGSSQEELLADFVSNPTLAVELDGSPATVIGFDSWFEDLGLEKLERSEEELRGVVDHRATWATWATWVGHWAELGEIAPGTYETTASNAAEFGGVTESPLTLDVSVPDGGGLLLRATSTLDRSAVEELWEAGGGIDPATGVEARPGEVSRVTVAEVATDAATLRPVQASYSVTVTVDGEVVGEVAHEWGFGWGACDGAITVGELEATVSPSSATSTGVDEPVADVFVPPGFDTVALDELPPEALDTLALIDSGGPFPYDKDGSVFGNFEGLLPDRPRGYYREYTVETPGSDDRGARRIVTGDDGEIYYTDDHYESFAVVIR